MKRCTLGANSHTTRYPLLPTIRAASPLRHTLPTAVQPPEPPLSGLVARTHVSAGSIYPHTEPSIRKVRDTVRFCGCPSVMARVEKEGSPISRRLRLWEDALWLPTHGTFPCTRAALDHNLQGRNSTTFAYHDRPERRRNAFYRSNALPQSWQLCHGPHNNQRHDHPYRVQEASHPTTRRLYLLGASLTPATNPFVRGSLGGRESKRPIPGYNC